MWLLCQRNSKVHIAIHVFSSDRFEFAKTKKPEIRKIWKDKVQKLNCTDQSIAAIALIYRVGTTGNTFYTELAANFIHFIHFLWQISI